MAVRKRAESLRRLLLVQVENAENYSVTSPKISGGQSAEKATRCLEQLAGLNLSNVWSEILESGAPSLLEVLGRLSLLVDQESQLAAAARELYDRWGSGNYADQKLASLTKADEASAEFSGSHPGATSILPGTSSNEPSTSDSDVIPQHVIAIPKHPAGKPTSSVKANMPQSSSNLDDLIHKLLHDIVLNNRVPALPKNYPARSARRHGHNNVEVGTWWPYQVCARRDGAHGESIAGICGTQDTGAFSIVSSGGAGYEDRDRDTGEVLFYSGSHGSEQAASSAEPPKTRGTLALETSVHTGTPVRVLRGKGSSIWAPDTGLRYDGLYKVVEMKLARSIVRVSSASGGERPHRTSWWKFKLVREQGQPPLSDVTARPTAQESRAFEEWKRINNKA